MRTKRMYKVLNINDRKNVSAYTITHTNTHGHTHTHDKGTFVNTLEFGLNQITDTCILK